MVKMACLASCLFSVSVLFVCVSKILAYESDFFDYNTTLPKNPKIFDKELFYAASRLPRLFDIQTVDDDLKVSADFGIPFFSVPVKKTILAAKDMAKNLMDFDMTSMMSSGIMGFIGATLGSSFFATGPFDWSSFKTSRLEDMNFVWHPLKSMYNTAKSWISDTTLAELLTGFEEVLSNENMNVTSCVQKTVCCVVQKSNEKVESGTGNSITKIIDAVTSFNWILNIVEGTALREAIDVAKNDVDCDHKFQDCTWEESKIQEFLKKHLNFL